MAESHHTIPLGDDDYPAMLAEIATLTGGQAYQATDKEELDAKLSEVLDRLEKSELDSSIGVETYAELFFYPLLFGLLLLGLELILRSTRFARASACVCTRATGWYAWRAKSPRSLTRWLSWKSSNWTRTPL